MIKGAGIEGLIGLAPSSASAPVIYMSELQRRNKSFSTKTDEYFLVFSYVAMHLW